MKRRLVLSLVVVGMSAGFVLGQTTSNNNRAKAMGDILERENTLYEAKQSLKNVPEAYYNLFDGYEKASRDRDYMRAALARIMVGYGVGISTKDPYAPLEAQMKFQQIQVLQNERVIQLLQKMVEQQATGSKSASKR